MPTKRNSILPSCFQRFDSKGIIFKLQLPRIKGILRAMNKGYSCFHLVWCIATVLCLGLEAFKGLRASLKLHRAAPSPTYVISPRSASGTPLSLKPSKRVFYGGRTALFIPLKVRHVFLSAIKLTALQ